MCLCVAACVSVRLCVPVRAMPMLAMPVRGLVRQCALVCVCVSVSFNFLTAENNLKLKLLSRVASGSQP